MRAMFFDRLKEVIKNDEKIFFLSGDTGFNLIEPLFEIAPKRCINVGVAEQNLIGMAAGLCNLGYLPICYAITNFIVHRCLEQIRNDICLHRHKIILVGTATGFDNGGLGGTHHILDDIGCMKPLPNINIYSPSGQKSMEIVLKEVMVSNQASFIRITKGDYIEEVPIFTPNHFIVQRPDTDVLVVTHGKMVKYCVEAAVLLQEFSLFAMDCIKPLDHTQLRQLFSRFGKIIVVEDNFSSGLFNSLCQWAIEHRIDNPQIYFIGPSEGYEVRIGDAAYLEDKYDLNPKKLAARIALIKCGECSNV